MRLRDHGRYDYSRQRRVYDWPGGRRLAVYMGLNVEHFAFGEDWARSSCRLSRSRTC